MTDTTPCPSRQQLQDYLSDSCSAEVTEVITTHLNECSQCRETIEQSSKNNTWLHSVLTDNARSELRKRLEDNPRSHFGISPTYNIEGLIARGILEVSDDSNYIARLGYYRIIELIGSGGMGIVLKAHQADLDRLVAIKILNPDLLHDPKAIARFTREAKAAGTLRHDNIVTIHSVNCINGIHFIVMEYIEGTSLKNILGNNNKLSAIEIRKLFRGLLSGLHAAHKKGLIHRDIKPANIMIERDSRRVKLVDFGLARMADSQTQLTVADGILGTPDYMSPEQARGEKDLDHRTDLYSAGAVLYEMLTGRKPFVADSPSAVISCILHKAPDSPKDICNADPHLSQLALRLLAKRPEDRFTSCQDVLTALDKSKGLSLPEQRRRIKRRLGISSLVAVLAILVFISGNIFKNNTPPKPADNGNQRISDVKKDDSIPSAVKIRLEGEANYTRLLKLELGGLIIKEASIANLDNGEQIIIVGSEIPINGNCLFGFSTTGKLLWKDDLTADFNWPGCDTTDKWRCEDIHIENLDKHPGDEIIAISTHSSLGFTGLSIVDSDTGKVRSTFWHGGNLDANSLVVYENFFGPDHPAIVVIGRNNYLDSKPVKRTVYNTVSVIMILDPWRLGGLSPLLDRKIDNVSSAYVHAYAFLDLPASLADIPDADTNGINDYDPDDHCATILNIKRGNDKDGKLTTKFELIWCKPLKKDQRGVEAEADHNLELLSIISGQKETVGRTFEYWKPRWRVIVREGKLLDHTN